jgi:hypothetical protein
MPSARLDVSSAGLLPGFGSFRICSVEHNHLEQPGHGRTHRSATRLGISSTQLSACVVA